MYQCWRYGVLQLQKPGRTFVRLSSYNKRSILQLKPDILKPFLFTLSVGTASFTGCAILQYELARMRIQNCDTIWDKVKKFRSSENKSLSFRCKLNQWWNSLDGGRKTAAVIIASNIFVFALWRVAPLQNFMTRWFLCSPSNRRVLTMLTSTFSHTEFWHLGANMFVLWSFAPLAHSIFGTEQFVAFYLTGGTVSSLLSHLVKSKRGINVPSLGASGALLAILAACCIESPESRLSILFLPFITFTAGTALYGIVALDLTGLVLGWKVFDHAAHLGGTLFGSWYTLYGYKHVWDKRDVVQRWWHDIRSNS